MSWGKFIATAGLFGAYELSEYVNSLSKKELQERLYDALVELEDIRNRYW